MSNHRTTDHIFALRTLIDKYVTYTTKGKLYTCFIDFKKAFDSVWHDGLLCKLLRYKIGGKFYDLIKTLYSKTKCSIKHGFQRSKCFDYANGVRQGCILSPMLFNLYLNEIPFLLDKQDTDPILLPDGSSLNCLLYADDLVLISSSTNGLQNALSTFSQFCRDWRMNINTKKTKAIIFQKKHRKSTILKHNFFINGENVEITNSYTYLGVRFSTNGSFKENKTILKEKTRRSFFATRRHLDFLKLPVDVINKIFNSLYLPILMYGSEVWSIYALGVNKQCPNVACRNELGRLSLKELADLNILKQCLKISKEFADKNQVSLVQKVNNLCATSNLNAANLAKNNYSSFLSQIRSSLNKRITEHQLNLIKCNKKLKFYSQFRTDCHKADCFNSINNPLHKKP